MGGGDVYARGAPWSLLAAFRILPWRFFAIWYLVSAVASFINTVRTLGAHRYASDGTPLDRDGQLGDSIDTPGAFWTELWAPVGLRYHALHHYFPGIPYHNLNNAYRRLIRGLPPDSRHRSRPAPACRIRSNALPRRKRLRLAAGGVDLSPRRASPAWRVSARSENACRVDRALNILSKPAYAP